MGETHRVRRGEKENILDVHWSYTLLIDKLGLDRAWEDDEVTLKSNDGQYEQKHTLGLDGDLVDERWIRVTFTEMKPDKFYTCLLDPKITSKGSSEGTGQPCSTTTSKGVSSDSQKNVQDKSQTNESISESCKGEEDSVSVSSEPMVLFRNIMMTSNMLNKPFKLEEDYDEKAVFEYSGRAPEDGETIEMTDEFAIGIEEMLNTALGGWGDEAEEEEENLRNESQQKDEMSEQIESDEEVDQLDLEKEVEELDRLIDELEEGDSSKDDGEGTDDGKFSNTLEIKGEPKG